MNVVRCPACYVTTSPPHHLIHARCVDLCSRTMWKTSRERRRLRTRRNRNSCTHKIERTNTVPSIPRSYGYRLHRYASQVYTWYTLHTKRLIIPAQARRQLGPPSSTHDNCVRRQGTMVCTTSAVKRYLVRYYNHQHQHQDQYDTDARRPTDRRSRYK